MQFTAQQIASMIQGEVIGNANAIISSVAKIEEAKQGDLSFVANVKYEPYLYTTQATVIIVNNSIELQKPIAATLIKVNDAYAAFATLLEKYNEILSPKTKNGIEQPSFISDSASIGKDVYVGAFAYIGDNAVIGDNSKIYPNSYIGDNTTIGNNTTIFAGVKIYHQCIVGNSVIIHSGVVIGSDGFGFALQQNGSYKKIPQLGNVVIEDNVEIGANTTIDRATMGSTVIKRGVKLDNLIQIAHNVTIGEHTVIAAQAGVSGSTKLGAHCIVGGQAGIVGHISLANGSKVNAQSGVSKSIKEENKAVTGSPAYDYNSALRSQAIMKNLPELLKRLETLEKQVAGIK